MTKSPLYKNVYDSLKADIGSGRIGPGEQLLSETKLAEEHNVSIITIRRAIHELVLDGLVESRHGIGSFVTEPGSSAVVVGMSSFTSDVASGRLRLVRTLLKDTMEMCPPEIALKLRIPPYSIVRTLVRLDSEGSRPISTDEARIPPQLAAHIDADIAGSPLFMHLWQTASGMDFERTEYDIWAERVTPEDQQLLHICSDTPILCTAETAYDKWDTPCLHVVTRYRGDRCRLTGDVVLVQSDTPKGRVGE